MASQIDNEMLEPHSAYHSKYKDEFERNAEELFDELTKKSKVDFEANRETLKKIRKLDKDIQLSEKHKARLQKIRRFMVIMSIILPIATGIVYLSKIDNYEWISLGIMLPISIALIVLTIVLHAKVFRKKIKGLLELLTGLRFRRDKLIKQASEQMAPLNVLFDWNIPAHLVEKTVKLIDMDQYFDAKKAAYLMKKYGYGHKDKDTSTVFVQSGNILGNPFLLCKDYYMNMINKTYYGSITITWTTIERTENGYETRYHSQTLTASVSAPAPSYGYHTYLVYGNDAAPKLCFSRYPSGMTGKTEKEIKKYVKKTSKKLVKKGEKSLLRGGTYQTFGNPEFEVLFGGTDRNNEMEFRLLFTPLAQKSLLDLIKNGKPYGDDFRFRKERCLNYISTSHSQFFDYSADPSKYVSIEYDECKRRFMEYNCKYFESFFFEIAPLMCVPLYQQHKSVEYMYNEELDANFAEFEHERMANTFSASELKHPNSCTGNIYKTRIEKSIGNSDKVIITARSFRGEPRVTYVSVYGGDGHYHDVPVHWVEYFPVEQETPMLVSKAEATRYQFNVKSSTADFLSRIKNIARSSSYHFQHCIFATLLSDRCTTESITDFNEVLTSGTTSVQTVDEMLKSLDIELMASQVDNSQKTGDELTTEVEGEAKEVKAEDIEEVAETKPQETEEVDEDTDDSEEDDSDEE